MPNQGETFVGMACQPQKQHGNVALGQSQYFFSELETREEYTEYRAKKEWVRITTSIFSNPSKLVKENLDTGVDLSLTLKLQVVNLPTWER